MMFLHPAVLAITARTQYTLACRYAISKFRA